MNRIIALLSALIVAATAFAQKDVTIFTAADDIARPITIKTNSGNYKLYNELRIDKHISWFEAYDGNGNKIMQPGASRDIHYSTEDESRLVKKYHFTTLYPSSSKGGSSSSGSKSSSGKKSHGREENIPEYEGDYSSVYYSNLEEYLAWRLPSPPTEQVITNPTQYCGKWASRVVPDFWTIDISRNGDQFSFNFKLAGSYELVKQETANSWLFRNDSYLDRRPELQKRNSSSYIDDCDSDADPGFPRSGTYKHDEYFSTWFCRLTLRDGRVYFNSIMCHREYYYRDIHTYSETFIPDDTGYLVKYKPSR